MVNRILAGSLRPTYLKMVVLVMAVPACLVLYDSFFPFLPANTFLKFGITATAIALALGVILAVTLLWQRHVKPQTVKVDDVSDYYFTTWIVPCSLTLYLIVVLCFPIVANAPLYATSILVFNLLSILCIYFWDATFPWHILRIRLAGKYIFLLATEIHLVQGEEGLLYRFHNLDGRVATSLTLTKTDKTAWVATTYNSRLELQSKKNPMRTVIDTSKLKE